jgi:hypothetical protein
VLYLWSGGSVTLDLSAATGSFEVDWYDPRSGAWSSDAPISGGSTGNWTAPTADDWVLLVRPP